MAQDENTTNNAAGNTTAQQDASYLDSARDRLSDAGGAIRDRVDGVVDAAKQNPGTAAAIAAGAAAAVGAAAYGISKLREGSTASKNDNSKK